jgi:hypothetical protein
MPRGNGKRVFTCSRSLPDQVVAYVCAASGPTARHEQVPFLDTPLFFCNLKIFKTPCFALTRLVAATRRTDE